MKNLIVLLFALLCLPASAQKFQPILKEGRSWKIVSPSIFPNEYDLYYTVTVGADTLIDNIQCKKILVECDIPKPWGHWTPLYVFDAAYEKDGKFYGHYTWGNKFMLLMDFNMKKGDKVYDGQYEVKDVDYVEIGGQKRRRIVIMKGGLDINCWIEGIGASDDCFWIEPDERPTGNYYYAVMIGCYDNGKLIFTRDDMVHIEPLPSAIEQVKAETAADGRAYDIAGRRITSPQKGEIYIKNGEKRVQH